MNILASPSAMAAFNLDDHKASSTSIAADQLPSTALITCAPQFESLQKVSLYLPA